MTENDYLGPLAKKGSGLIFLKMCGFVYESIFYRALIDFSTTDINIFFICDMLKVRLWVLMRGQTLTHLCLDISLITKHILDHNISLES